MDPNETTPTIGQAESESGFIRILRSVSFLALILGAAGSLFYMFRAGQQTPRLLLILFIIWVLSPFAVLLWARQVSRDWAIVTQWTLYWVTLIISGTSPVIYGEWVDIKPVGSANAFLFVAVPPVSLLLITIVLSMTALLSGRKSR